MPRRIGDDVGLRGVQASRRDGHDLARRRLLHRRDDCGAADLRRAEDPPRNLNRMRAAVRQPQSGQNRRMRGNPTATTSTSKGSPIRQ